MTLILTLVRESWSIVNIYALKRILQRHLTMPWNGPSRYSVLNTIYVFTDHKSLNSRIFLEPLGLR